MAGLQDLYSEQSQAAARLDSPHLAGSYYRLVDDADSPAASRAAIQDATTDVRRDNHAYRDQFRKRRDPNIYATFSNTVKSQTSLGRKPVSLSADVRLPPIERGARQANSVDLEDERPVSIASDESLKLTKNIVKWNFWWDKVESNIRVHAQGVPDYSKRAAPKVGSLDNYAHRPGGGNIRVLDQRPVWKKEPRTDHVKHDYQRSGEEQAP